MTDTVTLTMKTEFAWSLGCLLALGVWDALWYGLALGTALRRVLNRFQLRMW